MPEPKSPQELRFVPRIINPVKIRRAVVFAADADLRQAARRLEDTRPWLKTEIRYDPASLVEAPPAEPALGGENGLLLPTGPGNVGATAGPTGGFTFAGWVAGAGVPAGACL